MTPVPVMTRVEVIRGIATDDATFAMVRDLALGLDKTPVEVRDFPGFVANRILMPMINEATFYGLVAGNASSKRSNSLNSADIRPRSSSLSNESRRMVIG